MTRAVVFVVPGPLETRTGGSIYDRRMVEGLRQRGWPVDVLELPGAFPFPSPAARAHAAEALGTVRAGTITIVDGLALGAMPHVVTHHARRLRLVALVHLPLAADVGFDRDTATGFEAGERRTLAAAALVIVTSAATLPLLTAYGLRPGGVVVVEPGTDRAPLARGSAGNAVSLLSVATLHPGKGHEILLAALSQVPHSAWRLVCAGSLTRHPPTVERVRTAARMLRLDDRVFLAGDLDSPDLADAYDRADVFVLATRQETYGMAVAEALARGLPVVSTTTGAIPRLVGEEAGLIVPAGDVPALARALTRVLADAVLRARLAEGARRARERLPDWQHASAGMAAALESLDSHG
jgi:glycosyltransferase involved in cell wall biosynthesis